MDRKTRRILLLVAFTMASICALLVLFDYQRRPRLISGPMVQLVTIDGFTVAWEAHPSRPLTLRVSDARARVVAEAAGQSGGGRWFAAVNGLLPQTDYGYTLLDGDRVVARATTRTAPPPGRSFRFLAFGDSGDGSYAQYAVADELGHWTPDLVIHTGDLVYDRGELADYPVKFFRPYAALTASVPFYPVLGNHDVRTENGRPLLDVFVLPRNGPPAAEPETNYWFDFGEARFVAIDSNLHAPQQAAIVAPWLEGVLASAGDRWKILYFHEPIYTHGNYAFGDKMHEPLGEVMDRHGVHLVLCGHNHMYERTYPLRAGRIVPDGRGTVHIVSGGGGGHLYEERARPPEWMAAWYHDTHSFTVVDVTPRLIGIRQISVTGETVDTAHIPRTPITTQPMPGTPAATTPTRGKSPVVEAGSYRQPTG